MKLVISLLLSLTPIITYAAAKSPNTHFAFGEFMGFNLYRDLLNHDEHPVFLEDVVKSLGYTPIHHQCDNDQSIIDVCYKTKEGYIHFLSNHLNLSKVALTGFVLDGSKASQDCSDLNQDVKLDIEGLKIGMSTAEYKSLINKNNFTWLAGRIDPPVDVNSLEATNDYTVKYKEKHDGSDTNTLRICTYVAPLFKDDKLAKVTVSASCV